MADFPGESLGASTVIATEIPGRVDEAYEHPFPAFAAVVDDPASLDPDELASNENDDVEGDPKPAAPHDNHLGEFEDLSAAVAWFERPHVIERRYDFGNILSTQERVIEVVNAHRRETRDWTAFVNNAGAGTDIIDLPSLPRTIEPLESVVLTLQVLTSGAPVVDDTLDFTFDTGAIILVPITVTRIVLFSVRPELPYTETMEFLTDVVESKSGSERRASVRKNPRTTFSWDFLLEDGPERARIANLLFDWQSRRFGVPLWHFMTSLSADVASGDLVLPVLSTDYADYREGGLVVVWQDETTFHVGVIDETTSTTITLVDPIVGDFASGVIVAPVRAGWAETVVSGTRFPSADAQLRMRFVVDDNDSDLASTAAFPTLDGKVIFTGPNLILESFEEKFERMIAVFDGGTGLIEQISPWGRGKRVTPKGFFASGAQAAWEVRQVLHALRGRQVSFYLPSFSEDFELVDNLTLGSLTMEVEPVGYTDFVRSRTPWNRIRVVFVNPATPALNRTVVSSVAEDDQETLTLNTTWPSTWTPAEIERVELVEKVRFDSDQVEIRHDSSRKNIRFSAPVRTVFE